MSFYLNHSAYCEGMQRKDEVFKSLPNAKEMNPSD